MTQDEIVYYAKNKAVDRFNYTEYMTFCMDNNLRPEPFAIYAIAISSIDFVPPPVDDNGVVISTQTRSSCCGGGKVL